MKVDNIPKLRFPEFLGEWEIKKLGDIGKVKMCKRIFSNQTSESGDIPFFKIGTFGKEADAYIDKELYLEYRNKYSFPKIGDILMSASGTLGRTVVYDGIDAYFQDSNIVWLDNNEELVTNSFLFYIYQIVRYESEGGTIQRLYNSIISNAKFGKPTLPEQQKIASFLSSIDNKIELLRQKKDLLDQYKKGVMQQIFSQQIRFKDDDGNDFPDWDVMNFDDVFQSVSTKKHQIKSSEILEIGKNRVIDQGQNQIAGHSNEDAKLMSKLPVVIFGDHTTIIKYVNFPFIIGADGTKILKTKTNSDLKYLYYFITHNNVEQQGYRRHFSLLRNLIIEIPCDKEQTKISKFLSSIDDKIGLVNNQIDNTQNFKKGLLQQMFV